MPIFGQEFLGLEKLLRRPKPTAWQDFWRAPCLFVAQHLYSWRSIIPAQPTSNPVSVVCISDTHNNQPSLPEGDILIHAGDLTQSGSFQEIQATLDWLRSHDAFQHIIVIAGNHDNLLDPSRDRDASDQEQRASLDWGDIVYLQDSSEHLKCRNGRRLQVYGSPHSPKNGNWSFQYPRQTDTWSGRIPSDVDILITHCPPQGHLDATQIGCAHLLQELWRARSALHVFGHVHAGYGREWLLFDTLQKAYERVITARGGILNLLHLLYGFLCSKLVLSPREARCLLVNPAVVGGVFDQKRREPIRVVI